VLKRAGRDYSRWRILNASCVNIGGYRLIVSLAANQTKKRGNYTAHPLEYSAVAPRSIILEKDRPLRTSTGRQD
jgi:hypothetical protein